MHTDTRGIHCAPHTTIRTVLLMLTVVDISFARVSAWLLSHLLELICVCVWPCLLQGVQISSSAFGWVVEESEGGESVLSSCMGFVMLYSC